VNLSCLIHSGGFDIVAGSLFTSEGMELAIGVCENSSVAPQLAHLKRVEPSASRREASQPGRDASVTINSEQTAGPPRWLERIS